MGETDFLNSVWYKRTVNIRDDKNRVFLHIGACDYLTTLYINGKEIGNHKGGYTSFDITDHVSNGENTIVINAVDDTRSGFQPRGKQSAEYEPHGCKKGYLVWGEYASWGLNHSNIANLPTFLREWEEAIERDFNHPSIIGWCPFNETWDRNGVKQSDELIETVYKTTKLLDTTRPCIDTSGNFHVVTDIFDFHDYCQNVEEFEGYMKKLEEENILIDQSARMPMYQFRQWYKGEPVFASEYGGIKWDAEGDEKSWGYGNAPKTEDEFIERYKGLTEAILKNSKIFGFCYTQLYDVEQERNGLYTYERKPKFDMNIFKKINLQKAEVEK